jgi:hypothetical protein
MHRSHILLFAHFALDEAGERTLEIAVRRMGLSARAHGRVLKVARTIADLNKVECVSAKHLAEACTIEVWIARIGVEQRLRRGRIISVPSTVSKSFCERTFSGRIRRSSSARRAFKELHPCPATGSATGACPGHVIDHVKALKHGGTDTPGNMQWQTIAAARAKDRVE